LLLHVHGGVPSHPEGVGPLAQLFAHQVPLACGKWLLGSPSH
jgi:hypothetical protein